MPGQLVPAGDEQLLVNLKDDVFEPAHRNAILLRDFGIGNAPRHKQSDMVFAQGELESDVIVCELVMEGDPVFPGVLPLFNDRAVTVREFLLKALLHQAAEGGDKLCKGGDKAVGQGEAHGLKQPAPGLSHAPEIVAGDGTGDTEIEIGNGDPPFRRAKSQRGLRYGQGKFVLAQAVKATWRAGRGRPASPAAPGR